MLALTVTVVALAWSAWSPARPLTWLLETVWVVIGLLVVLLTWRRFPLTDLLCVVLAAWALVLAVGGHDGYAHAQAGTWVQDWLGLSRNPFDRLGHFMQGFAPAVAFREVLWRTSPLTHSRWLGPLTLACCMTLSAGWELAEWLGAYLVQGGDPAFLGGQGDVWDTQWDMLMCLVGASVSLLTLHRRHDLELTALTGPTAAATMSAH